jgi:AraC-like DNA-binding protein
MSDSRSDRIYFNTDALPERDRFPAFCEEMFRHIIGADIERLGSMPFRGVLEARRAGAVAIANISTTSADLIRNGSYLRDGDDAVVVQLWQQGRATATQGRHENQINACDGLVIDNAEAARIRVEDASRFWVLTIPRNRIVGLRPDFSRFAGTKLGDDLSLRLLSGYLEGTLAQDLDSHPAGQLFGEHLIDLVAVALGGVGDEREFEEASGVRAARLAAILRMISNRLADHGLNAATIAAQMGVTPRYVQLLLEQSGQTFTQHILRKRLEKAKELLVRDVDQNRKIADIALEVGFTDLSHFNRAFRRYFGDTPSGVRASATLGRARR